MTSVNFTGFVVTKTSPADGLEVSDVPIKVSLPESGVSFLYQLDDTRAVIAQEILKAGAQDKVFSEIIIRLKVPTAKFPTNRVSMVDLPKVTVLNFKRVREDVLGHCVKVWDRYAEIHDISAKKHPNPFNNALLDMHLTDPGFIDFMHRQKEFKHLEAIIYRVKEPGRDATFNIATLFSDASVEKAFGQNVQGTFKVVLPKRVRSGARKTERKSAVA